MTLNDIECDKFSLQRFQRSSGNHFIYFLNVKLENFIYGVSVSNILLVNINTHKYINSMYKGGVGVTGAVKILALPRLA